MKQFQIQQELAAYGIAPNEILSLEHVNASTLNYLDLQTNWRESCVNVLAVPVSVVEIGGRPLMYVIRATALSGSNERKSERVTALRRVLACRGESAYIGIVELGKITVVPAYYASDLTDSFLVRQDSERADVLIRDLAMEVCPSAIPREQWRKSNETAERMAVHHLLFGLLDRVTKDLRVAGPLVGKDAEILSLVGRCLFTCFLIDRGIINQSTFPALWSAGVDKAFATAEFSALTCQWLDNTFNGELLPLANDDYLNYFKALDTPLGEVFSALSKIIHRTTPDGQYHLDCSWIDFSHVPVGLLSQVYESYTHQFFDSTATAQSVHYTPRHIAEFMVDQAFDGISTCRQDEAQVLDPAAGAGVFLVFCFRRLVKAFWQHNHRPPNTMEIRRILNQQIRGLDINEHALKLAALSLYLTAIELDSNPLAGQSLHFDPLMGNVLFNTRRPDDRPEWKSLIQGSLGYRLEEMNVKRPFSLVIGNPPWTQWSSKEADNPVEKDILKKRVDALNSDVSELIQGIAARRDPELLADISRSFENPGKVPDVPFIWCAMEWADKGAVIAFAMHARLLFKRADKGVSARETLFSALHITGVVNGSAVRQEKVWPNNDAQFCLIFARNRIPSSTDFFYYLSPEVERELNKKSMWRIDYQSAQPVEFGVLEKNTYLLKTLFKGTMLDADVVRRINSLVEEITSSGQTKAQRIEDYWIEGRGLYSGQGLITSPGKQDASYLVGSNAKVLTSHDKAGRYIDTSKLKNIKFSGTIERARRKEIFLPPLVLFSQTPGAKKDSIPARISLDNSVLAYNFSYYGYSAHGHPCGEQVSKYLFILAYSPLLNYYTLMTSARYGIERDTIFVEDIGKFPIIPFESLTDSQIFEVDNISKGLLEGRENILNEVDLWVSRLYDLDENDTQVIRDTLLINTPSARSRQRAEEQPSIAETREFAEIVQAHLQPFFELSNESIQVEPRFNGKGAWRFLDLTVGAVDQSGIDDSRLSIEVLKTFSDHEGASRIFARISPGRMTIGILSQYRYWTPSRARLCAIELLREHGDWLDGQESEDA
jgi:hypothetical protein